MSKFTAGKWEHGTHSIKAVTLEETIGIAFVYKANNKEETKANTRLIAAAPEMYRLLQNFVYPEEPITTRTLNLSNRAWELLRRIDGEEAEA